MGGERDGGWGMEGWAEASPWGAACSTLGRQPDGHDVRPASGRRAAWSRQLASRSPFPHRHSEQSGDSGPGRAGVTAALNASLTLLRHPERREGSGPERAGETAAVRPALHPTCHPEPREGSDHGRAGETSHPSTARHNRCHPKPREGSQRRRLRSWQSTARATASVEIPGSRPGQALRLRAKPSAQDDGVRGALAASWRSPLPGLVPSLCTTQDDAATPSSWRVGSASPTPSPALARSPAPVELVKNRAPSSS